MRKMAMTIVVLGWLCFLFCSIISLAAENGKKVAQNRFPKCEKGQPDVYVQIKGKWAVGKIYRIGEKCFQ